MVCPQDDAGFHIEPGDDTRFPRRTTQRDGRDAYAYRCTVCGTVGDIVEGRFVPRDDDDECEHRRGNGPEWRRCVRCGEVLR